MFGTFSALLNHINTGTHTHPQTYLIAMIILHFLFYSDERKTEYELIQFTWEFSTRTEQHSIEFIMSQHTKSNILE